MRSSPHSDDLPRPDQLAGYPPVRELGRGATGAVYLAQAAGGLQVAIKRLPGAAPADDQATSQLRQHVALLVRIDHPNVVRVLDLLVTGSDLCVVMEYVPGTDLRQVLASQRPVPEDVAELITQLASGIDYLHAVGVVHRDVKPSNVLVAAQGTVKLADVSITDTLGTPVYMAPEQAMGRPDVDGRADVYSLAVIAYEALVGRPPFPPDARGPKATMEAHISQEPPDPSTHVPGFPRAIAQALLWGLAKEPSRRPGSAGQFADALQSMITATAQQLPKSLPAAGPETMAPPTRPPQVRPPEPGQPGGPAETPTPGGPTAPDPSPAAAAWSSPPPATAGPASPSPPPTAQWAEPTAPGMAAGPPSPSPPPSWPEPAAPEGFATGSTSSVAPSASPAWPEPPAPGPATTVGQFPPRTAEPWTPQPEAPAWVATATAASPTPSQSWPVPDTDPSLRTKVAPIVPRQRPAALLPVGPIPNAVPPRPKISRLGLILGLVAVGVGLALTVYAAVAVLPGILTPTPDKLQVTSLQVKALNSQGHCPSTTFKFDGTITTNGAGGTVQYQWTRPDGTQTTPSSVQLQPGSTSSHVSLDFPYTQKQSAQGQARLRILNPGNQTSAPATVLYSCP